MHGKLLCVALALFTLAVEGCSETQPNSSSRRGIEAGEQAKVVRAAPAPTPPPPPPPPPPSSLSSPFEKKLDPGALQQAAPPGPEQIVQAPAAPAVDAGKPRDLSSELAERLGSPTSCLDLEKVVQAGGRLNVVVVAEVMPSGRITRAQASAGDQPGSALHCLENKATSAGLRGPVPGAPLSVTATLPIEVASQPTLRSP